MAKVVKTDEMVDWGGAGQGSSVAGSPVPFFEDDGTRKNPKILVLAGKWNGPIVVTWKGLIAKYSVRMK
jgi:hypothetical protein